MRLEEKLAGLFNKQNIASVLDLGAGRGRWSIFCASYGAKVIAIDNQSKVLWQFPEHLKNHPSITFLEADIKDLNLNFNQTFDLILLFNVVVFVEKRIVLDQILQHYLSQLKP